MESNTKNLITVEAVVNAPVSTVWDAWNLPVHITKWCFASDDWHAPAATNDLREGGSFSTTMAAKDGSFSFDFGGIYNVVRLHELIGYTMGDGRKVEIVFKSEGGQTSVVETFEAETQHSLEMQRSGWQAILDNFAKYAAAL